MNKIFLSADIEGTCGIAHWDETLPGRADYPRFQDQMTREVAAACAGFSQSGVEEIFVRDAHDTARNLKAEALPEYVRLFRGWGKDPRCMMSGIAESFGGAAFTGYHSGAGWAGNPLSHTMNLQVREIQINGESAAELMINSLTASYYGVPVLLLTGDEGLCAWMGEHCPGTVTVPVSQGVGNGSISIHPEEALRRIQEGAARAAKQHPAQCLFPMPEHFAVETAYQRHFDARNASFYPGAKQLSPCVVRYESDDWMDCLTFFHFCL